MKNFLNDLKLVYKVEYKMKPYKGLAIYPKIIQAKPLDEFNDEEKANLTRKGFYWYVYFSYINDEGKYQKQNPIKLGVNKDFKKFEHRYKAIHVLLKDIKKLLDDGHSPNDVSIVEGKVLTIDNALDYALSNKKLKVSEDTYKDYEIRAKQLKRFLKKKSQLYRTTEAFNYKIIREFLKDIAKTSTMGNRNNVLRVVKALFSEMYENDLISENYTAKIKIEKVKTQRFKSYSYNEAHDIAKHLEKEDPILSLLVKFLGYNFLRIKEVVRLRVEDINIEEKILKVFVKQGKYKAKRIPDDIINDLSKYDLSKKGNLLFCLNSISGNWDRSEKGRTEYYSKRYTKIVRDLGFGEGFTLYSNRHTYITIGYKNLRKRLSVDDALDELMKYTGHETRDSLHKYIHYIDAEIVPEYKGEVI